MKYTAFVVKDTIARHKRTTKSQTIYIKFKRQILQTVLIKLKANTPWSLVTCTKVKYSLCKPVVIDKYYEIKKSSQRCTHFQT